MAILFHILFPFKIENVDHHHEDYQAFQRKTNEQIIALMNAFKKLQNSFKGDVLKGLCPFVLTHERIGFFLAS